MCIEFSPLMGEDLILVNIAGTMAVRSLHAMSRKMAANFKGQLTLQEVDELIASFIKYAEAGGNEKVGFSNSSYGILKIGGWKATAILAERRHPGLPCNATEEHDRALRLVCQ
ncbi:Carbonyl reductase NADPH 1 [Taenia solium]|eukprot:TsM_000163300 transcript=TsM_000163300 gene=TsM_000163300